MTSAGGIDVGSTPTVRRLKAIHRKRLENVARALMESPNPEHFSMETFASDHSCGTPACALGHYAWRTDLQGAFRLREIGDVVTRDGRRPENWFGYVCHHFGISLYEYIELFSNAGCGNAKTPEQAAAYILDFVERHR